MHNIHQTYSLSLFSAHSKNCFYIFFKPCLAHFNHCIFGAVSSFPWSPGAKPQKILVILHSEQFKKLLSWLCDNEWWRKLLRNQHFWEFGGLCLGSQTSIAASKYLWIRHWKVQIIFENFYKISCMWFPFQTQQSVLERCFNKRCLV